MLVRLYAHIGEYVNTLVSMSTWNTVAGCITPMPSPPSGALAWSNCDATTCTAECDTAHGYMGGPVMVVCKPPAYNWKVVGLCYQSTPQSKLSS
jgi:hypothetical protein